jgi:pyrroloquinoline quinone biosynthesis protein B
VIVRVLGSAAGGGVPQWNCACANCAAARSGRQPRRLQSCVAIGDGEHWVLLNCSPDIAAQIESFPALQPRARRDTPICGMLFTDANVDHLGGLAVLRQTGSHRFTLRSSSAVRELALKQPAFAPFAHEPHRWLELSEEVCEPVDADDFAAREFEIRAFDVPGLTPGYAGRKRKQGAVVALEIRKRGDVKTFLFAPVFAAINDTLRAAIARADIAMLDGSFFNDGELVESGLMAKTARHLGHQPVGGAGGTLEAIAGVRGRVLFTHMNNSNPMLDPDSEASARMRAANAELAWDGMELAF